MGRLLDDGVIETDKLFACLAEQVKLPLIQMAFTAETLDLYDGKKLAAGKETIIESSQAALRTIDGFLLSLKLQNQSRLDLEPVSVSSLLYDVSQALYDYSKFSNCEIELDISGRQGQVMSHYPALKSALVNLGYSFMAAEDNGKGAKTIRLVSKRTGKGILTGVFTESAGLSSSLLKQAKRISGVAHQPLAKFSSDNAAGVFIADNLFSSIGSSMKVAKNSGSAGLAATLMPSSQLSLV